MGFNFGENVNTVFERLEDFFKSKTVVGEPISIGTTTIIPVMDIAFGVGSGGGDGTDEKGNKGVGGGGGGVGVKATPTAIIVIKDDKVEVLPIKKTGGLDKLVDMVPDILSKINLDKKKEEPKAE